MGDQKLNDSTPQFSTAEYAGSAPDHCSFCKQMIADQYYRVNGAMACGSCADRAQRELPAESPATYARACLFGVVAAIAGLILYAAVGIITGWIIGFVSLAVGYLVGKAMMKGSNGMGGRRYQITAVVLTYAAVSMAAIPIWISAYAKQQKEKPAQVQQQQQPQNQEAAAPESREQAPKSLGAAIGYLALLGLASPLLDLYYDPFHGLIGLVILFVGVQIAWKITAGSPRVEVSGPFDNRPAGVATG